jgi:hypothetical protein
MSTGARLSQYCASMRVGCIGLVGLLVVALVLLQILSNSAKSLLTILPVVAGIWLFMFLQNRKETDDEWD